ncbi:hypothetical protein IFM89_025612 [Coptis chinensis]|uniref:Tubulin binding cofactor C-like domain-containing protein n=1 Tax=Coptis chinensis TaxID=261450 RepID=A0A835LIL1_9MAGN|nr:hypothetical protein IFM89_025612 [Coptis chinensis]
MSIVNEDVFMNEANVLGLIGLYQLMSNVNEDVFMNEDGFLIRVRNNWLLIENVVVSVIDSEWRDGEMADEQRSQLRERKCLSYRLIRERLFSQPNEAQTESASHTVQHTEHLHAFNVPPHLDNNPSTILSAPIKDDIDGYRNDIDVDNINFINDIQDMVYSATDEDSVTLITLIHSRKLKENFDPSTKRKSHTDLNLEDDRPIDPVPSSSKATIKPKPIAYGSPLMPYITAAKRICIANCQECVFFLGVNQQPFILGDNHKLQVAPYNTFYPQLEEHMSQVSVDATINRWNEPLVLGMVDPQDSLSHPTGVSDVQAESATSLDPD